MNMVFKRKLPIPKEIKEMYPLDEASQRTKSKRDEELKKIFKGEIDKFILIVGPCSADNEPAVLDYISRLAKLNEVVKDKLFIIPRIYTNKPRSTGEGYLGMLHQPDPNGSPDILNGLIAIRRLHMNVLSKFGFTCADEMLYPENHRYLSDVLGYVSVGARSSENQEHRLVASGLNIPVGMKNPMSGDLHSVINSVNASQIGHTFLYRGWEVESKGNEYCHVILRGYVDSNGKSVPNYHFDDLLKINELYKQSELKNPSVIVDCNHSNSNKEPMKQIDIAFEVLKSKKTNKDIDKLVKGLMIESYLEDGASEKENKYGQSITDPCLGWALTEDLIMLIYKQIKGINTK